MAVLTTITVLSVLAVVVLAALTYDARAKLRQIKAKAISGRIPSKPIWELTPRFALTPYGPSRDTEILHIAAVKVEGGVSDLESWILCNLAKDAKGIFELGTATGKTTYLLAKNAPQDARIVTMTLHPDAAVSGRHEPGDDKSAITYAARESVFDTFLYSGSDVEGRITQIFADSKQFDETPYVGSMNLIFVDGDHSESYVRNDTEKALKMLAPGGWLLWHDYRGKFKVPGAWRYLNALALDLPLVHIQGTSLVAYQKPVQA